MEHLEAFWAQKQQERNSHNYHAYRKAVADVLNALPEEILLPLGFAVALGKLKEVHEEAEVERGE